MLRKRKNKKTYIQRSLMGDLREALEKLDCEKRAPEFARAVKRFALESEQKGTLPYTATLKWKSVNHIGGKTIVDSHSVNVTVTKNSFTITITQL